MSSKPEVVKPVLATTSLSPAKDQEETRALEKAAEQERIKKEKELKAMEEKAKQGKITAEEKKA